jgi:hypothetical protein
VLDAADEHESRCTCSGLVRVSLHLIHQSLLRVIRLETFDKYLYLAPSVIAAERVLSKASEPKTGLSKVEE